LHFAGHGGPEVLYVDRERPAAGKSPAQKLPKGGLGLLLAALTKQTRVVVLNACHSAAAATPLLSAVECVIGMRGPISDTAALAFAGSLYGALSDGMNVQEAYDAAVAGIGASGQPETDRPLLLTRDGIDASEVCLLPKLRIFAVHADSAKDRTLAAELNKMLAPLVSLGVIDVGSNDTVPLRRKRRDYLIDELERADVLLPLVSIDLLNDGELLEAIAEVMRRREALCVVPIQLRPADFRSTCFGQLQALPRSGSVAGKGGDHDAIWTGIVGELRGLLAGLLSERNLADHDRLMKRSRPPATATPVAPATAPAVPISPSPPAAATAPPVGKRPTGASLRQALTAASPNTDEFDGLCRDHFERVARQFSAGMQLTSRINLLFQYVPLAEIVTRFWDDPRFAPHRALVKYE
jgi:hypothetical protein